MNELENKYKAFLQEINLKRARAGAMMPAILVMAFSLLDDFSHPEYANRFLFLRIVCSALLLLAWAISYTKRGSSYGKALGIFEMSICAIMINIMIRYIGYETPYYAGLNLVILGIGVLFPWGLSETLSTSIFVYGSYLVPILLFDKISNGVLFFNNNIFLLATIIIASTASYYASALRRREFMARYQLEDSQRQLEDSYEKLQESDRAKSRFFANISHELRTPTTFILGPVEMFINRELGLITFDQEKYLRVIHRNATRLLNIINKLMDLMKSESGSVELICQRSNFVNFVGDIVQSLIPIAEKKMFTLSFSGDANIPEFFFDSDKMEEVFYNLLGNALKFTKVGGITVSCTEQYGSVLVKVTDTGCGIPTESLQNVFERFYQVDNEASRVGMGTGIGLALVKDWVELHGGRVWVESEEGMGSTFFLTIPMQTQEKIERRTLRIPGEERRDRDRRSAMEEVLALVPEIPQENPSRAEEGFERILIVDDMPDMITFISDQLKNDYDCIFAKDGAEGIARARVAQPDLIISDVMMPVKDGYQLCRELKGDPETASIPIILLTAKGLLSDKIEGLEEGADDYLTKPFNKEELKARVRTLLRVSSLQKDLKITNRQLSDTIEEVRRVGNEFAQSEKMASLGLLIAGVAHELNNPISFAKGSLLVIHRHFDRIEEGKAIAPEEFSEIRQDIIESLDVIKGGLARAEVIIKTLSCFIRKDEVLFTDVDIHAGLDVTLELLHYDWKPGIEVQRDYYEMPVFIEGIPGQLNQVYMNIFQNALHSMGSHGTIFIKTDLIGDEIAISIRDTGHGIPEENLSKLFDAFFTTKEVGKGTGLGLSLAYKIIVGTHHGKIDVKSQVGEGSEFIITLPMKQPSALLHH
jgi:signal transduction histidine kinase